MDRKFKYTTKYFSVPKTVPDESKDKYLAQASLKELKNIIPDVDLDKNFDLLPLSYEAFNANKFNKNDDGVSSETAVAFYKSLINKPLNKNHNRKAVVGVILSSVLTDYITAEEITEEQAIKLKTPFNISCGSLYWKIVDKNLGLILEASGDPESEYYGRIFTSFEIGFDEYCIWKIEGTSKNFEDGVKVTDPEELKKLDPLLRANGGLGKIGDTYLYREVVGDVLGLGVGLVENPAGYLKPIATLGSEEDGAKPIFEEVEGNDKIEIIAQESVLQTIKIAQENGDALQTLASNINKNQINENFSSQLEKPVVKTNNETKIMPKKFTKIEEITDEALKEATASTIQEFVQNEISRVAKDFSDEKKAKEDAVTSLKTVQAELETVKNELTEIKNKAVAKESQEKFTARMTAFDDKYELTKEDRGIIGTDIKDLSDEAYASYEKKMEVLLKAKSKELIKVEKEAAAAKKENKQEAVAEVKSENAAETALENADKEKSKLPNAASAEVSLTDKYKAAFNIEGYLINPSKKAKNRD